MPADPLSSSSPGAATTTAPTGFPVTGSRSDRSDLAAAETIVGAERAVDLHARSGGHPLFLVELAEAPPGQLPATIRDIVARRCEAAGPDVAATLRTAALLGPVVDLDLLAGTRPVTQSELVDHLETGLTRRLLEERADGFGFRHELVREALAAGVSSPRRALVHREAALALARRPEADTLAVAHHARLGGDAETEAAALMRASDTAIDRPDNFRGWIVRNLGAFAEADDANEAALALVPRAGDEPSVHADLDLLAGRLLVDDAEGARRRLALVDESLPKWKTFVWRARLRRQYLVARLHLLEQDWNGARVRAAELLDEADRRRIPRYSVLAELLDAEAGFGSGEAADRDRVDALLAQLPRCRARIVVAGGGRRPRRPGAAVDPLRRGAGGGPGHRLRSLRRHAHAGGRGAAGTRALSSITAGRSGSGSAPSRRAVSSTGRRRATGSRSPTNAARLPIPSRYSMRLSTSSDPISKVRASAAMSTKPARSAIAATASGSATWSASSTLSRVYQLGGRHPIARAAPATAAFTGCSGPAAKEEASSAPPGASTRRTSRTGRPAGGRSPTPPPSRRRDRAAGGRRARRRRCREARRPAFRTQDGVLGPTSRWPRRRRLAPTGHRRRSRPGHCRASRVSPSAARSSHHASSAPPASAFSHPSSTTSPSRVRASWSSNQPSVATPWRSSAAR